MIKGDDNLFKESTYLIAYLSCFLIINALFFNAFKANNYLVFVSLAKNTLPNDPLPNYLIISNDEIPILTSSAIVEKFLLPSYELFLLLFDYDFSSYF